MQPGDVVADRFEILGSAGSGGMGVVYRARDRTTQDTVALKMLHAARASSADRFAREAVALAALQHPGIVRHIDHGVMPDGSRYLVMQWLEGEDLAERLARGPLEIAESVVLSRRVAESLAAAHAQGIVHRDVKPRNLFLVGGDTRKVTLLDFGLARLTDGGAAMTATGLILGTPGYVAPEQIRASRDIGPPADIFALGCVLFRCLTGSAPFTGEDLVALLAKVLFEEAPLASQLRREVPAELDELIVRMTAKEPADRPRSAAALATELADIEALLASTGPRRVSVPSHLTRAEQRIVSVVVADMTGRGENQPTLTPEEFATLDRTTSRVREIVTPHGAKLEGLTGGYVIATWSGGASANDQAAQAARCALAIRTEAPAAVIALATGRAVVGSHGAIGEVIDRAIEQVRGSRGVSAIRVDDTTAGLLGARFDLASPEESPEANASGTLFLRGERTARTLPRLLLGRPTPCVGRDRELRALQAIFEECASERAARVVLVTAAAGVGKSRLRYELARRLTERGPVQIWMARGDPMSAGSPLGLASDLVRGAAGVLDGEPSTVRARKLRGRLSRHFEGADLARMTEFLGELAQIPSSGPASAQLRAARRDAMSMGDQMRRAWEDLLAAECAETPLILVLEDLQWSDLATVRFVDSALRSLSDRPLMVMALARPEVHDLFPDLWRQRALTEVRLPELSPKASESLARSVLGDAGTSDMVSGLVQRAQGNAFYLEELIRSAAEGHGDELPGSVVVMIQARLERLEPEARQALTAASVFGQAFWGGAVVALLGGPERAGDVDAWLDELGARELVTRRSESRFPGQREYVFRHAVVREVAYGILTEENRKLGHRLAGEWLEGVGARDAMVLAEHFERGGSPERAIDGYRRAAEQALGGNDFVAVVERAERGVACGAAGERLGGLLLLQTEALGWLADFARAASCAEQAMRHLVRGSEPWYAAAGEAARATGRLANADALTQLVQELTAPDLDDDGSSARVAVLARIALSLLILGGPETARSLLARCEGFAQAEEMEPAVVARVLAAQAIRALMDGDIVGYLDLSEKAMHSFEEAGDVRDATIQRQNVGSALLELGAPGAEGLLRETYDACERLGLAHLSTSARMNIAMAMLRRGDLGGAEALLLRTLEDLKLRKERRLETYVHAYLAMVHQRRADYTAMILEAERAVELAPERLSAQVFALGTLAAAHVAGGQVAEGLAEARRALDLLVDLGGVESGESAIRLTYAEALEASGDHAAALAAFASARDRLLERAEKIRDPARRETFLRNISENARTLELAREFLGGAAPTASREDSRLV
jgi:serine/threonine protein kinase/tetratricopeptide (TPR) repeat protein